MSRFSLALPLIFLHLMFISGVLSASFTFTNNCKHPVWPGILASAGTSPLSTTGFVLQKGESNTVSAPTNWSGRMWGRTVCEDSSGKFSCVTGDCGSGKLECSGRGAAPPATLAEFTLDGSGGLDFYDVSLVDGYNLPMLVVPQSGSGNCSSTGCLVDLNGACPSELKVHSSGGGDNIACKSACEAFGDPRYCCSGEYGNPNTCKPSSYSEFFKHACPRAYSYAYDDGTSTFTCSSADYVITFCPTIKRPFYSIPEKTQRHWAILQPTQIFLHQKSSHGKHPEAAELPLVNSSMILTGADGTSQVAIPMQHGPTVAIFAAILAVSYQLRLL